VDIYEADVVSVQDYYPFGMQMPGRSYSNGQDGYRYGFNGKENDNEVKGEGNQQDYGMRIYDPRLGKFLSVDPMASKMPGEGPYSSMGNNPILNIDPDGNFAVPVHKRITINAFNNSGLSKGFLSRFKTDLVVGATRYSDYYGFAYDHHFDGRKNFTEVKATWAKLNNDIDSRIKNIGSGNKKFGGYDVERLGINVHNVQDFYSHSNYVELYIEYYKSVNNGAMPTEVPIYSEGVKIEGFKTLMERTTTDKNGKYQGLHSGTFSVTKFVEDKAKGKTDTDPNSHEQMNKDEVNTPEGKLAEDVATRHTTEILKRVKEK
jgi:RHS repeat-associated protein